MESIWSQGDVQTTIRKAENGDTFLLRRFPDGRIKQNLLRKGDTPVFRTTSINQINATSINQINTASFTIAEGKINVKQKLYQTKSEPVEYGTFLAVNSKGQYVLEIKGTGEVKAFALDEIEEVVPYTVKVERAGNVRHLAVPSDALSVGDVIVLDHGIWYVSEVDTKYPDPSDMSGKTLRKVSTETIKL